MPSERLHIFGIDMYDAFTHTFGLPNFIESHAPKLQLGQPEKPKVEDQKLRRLVVRLYTGGHQRAASYAARGDIHRALQEILFDIESEGLKKRVMPKRPKMITTRKERPVAQSPSSERRPKPHPHDPYNSPEPRNPQT